MRARQRVELRQLRLARPPRRPTAPARTRAPRARARRCLRPPPRGAGVDHRRPERARARRGRAPRGRTPSPAATPAPMTFGDERARAVALAGDAQRVDLRAHAPPGRRARPRRASSAALRARGHGSSSCAFVARELVGGVRRQEPQLRATARRPRATPSARHVEQHARVLLGERARLVEVLLAPARGCRRPAPSRRRRRSGRGARIELRRRRSPSRGARYGLATTHPTTPDRERAARTRRSSRRRDGARRRVRRPRPSGMRGAASTDVVVRSARRPPDGAGRAAAAARKCSMSAAAATAGGARRRRPSRRSRGRLRSSVRDIGRRRERRTACGLAQVARAAPRSAATRRRATALAWRRRAAPSTEAQRARSRGAAAGRRRGRRLRAPRRAARRRAIRGRTRRRRRPRSARTRPLGNAAAASAGSPGAAGGSSPPFEERLELGDGAERRGRARPRVSDVARERPAWPGWRAAARAATRNDQLRRRRLRTDPVDRSGARAPPGRRTLNWWPQLVHRTVVPRPLTSASSNSYSVLQRSHWTSIVRSSTRRRSTARLTIRATLSRVRSGASSTARISRQGPILPCTARPANANTARSNRVRVRQQARSRVLPMPSGPRACPVVAPRASGRCIMERHDRPGPPTT